MAVAQSEGTGWSDGAITRDGVRTSGGAWSPLRFRGSAPLTDRGPWLPTSPTGPVRSPKGASLGCQTESVAASLFEMLGPEATQALRRRGQRRQYRRREVLFREGDIGDSVYVIERGHVVVKGERTPGETLTLSVLGPGDYFGEVAVLSAGGRRSAGVETLDACVTLIVPGSDFLELRDRYPQIRRAMTESLARTCRHLVERLVDGRHIDARGRLIRQLLRLQDLFGGSIPFTQEDLANYVGVTRVTVNQLLAALTAERLIEVRRGAVRVIDPALLREQI
jgi:CRP/FNR family transcriptional regulator, cyclic AMP receptor protein